MKVYIAITTTPATNADWLKALTDRLDQVGEEIHYEVVDGSETPQTLPQRLDEIIQAVDPKQYSHIFLCDPDDLIDVERFREALGMLYPRLVNGVWLRERAFTDERLVNEGLPRWCCKAIIRTELAKDGAARTLRFGHPITKYVARVDQLHRLTRHQFVSYLWRQHADQLSRQEV